eukprot:SAG25_NODE_1861_length_2244_cov_1.411189_2_plen_81_part_00
MVHLECTAVQETHRALPCTCSVTPITILLAFQNHSQGTTVQRVVLGVGGAVVVATFVAIKTGLELCRGKLCHERLQLGQY